MTNRHLIFIVNEFSGNGKKTVSTLHKSMQNFDCTYEIHPTSHSKHAILLTEDLAKNKKPESLIVAVGGDGTLNEVLEGLLETETTHPIPLAYIPTGSGNDFARSLKLPLTFKDSIHNILKTKEPTLLDVITETANQKTIVAVNSIGFGLDGMVMNKLGKNKNKQIIGKLSYLLTILSAYFSQKAFPLKLKTPDQTYVYGQTLLVVCTNNKFFGGGISIHPEADPSDGFIDLIIAEKVTIWELFTILFSLFTTKKHLEHKKLHSHRITACDIVIYTPQYGQYDGELIDKDVHKLSFKLTTHPFWI